MTDARSSNASSGCEAAFRMHRVLVCEIFCAHPQAPLQGLFFNRVLDGISTGACTRLKTDLLFESALQWRRMYTELPKGNPLMPPAMPLLTCFTLQQGLSQQPHIRLTLMLIIWCLPISSSCIWMAQEPQSSSIVEWLEWSMLREVKFENKRTQCHFWFVGKIRHNTTFSHPPLQLDFPSASKWPYSSLDLATLRTASWSRLREMLVGQLG